MALCDCRCRAAAVNRKIWPSQDNCASASPLQKFAAIHVRRDSVFAPRCMCHTMRRQCRGNTSLERSARLTFKRRICICNSTGESNLAVDLIRRQDKSHAWRCALQRCNVHGRLTSVREGACGKRGYLVLRMQKCGNRQWMSSTSSLGCKVVQSRQVYQRACLSIRAGAFICSQPSWRIGHSSRGCARCVPCRRSSSRRWLWSRRRERSACSAEPAPRR